MGCYPTSVFEAMFSGGNPESGYTPYHPPGNQPILKRKIALAAKLMVKFDHSMGLKGTKSGAGLPVQAIFDRAGQMRDC